MDDETRKGFTFYESYAKALRRISKKADRATAYDMICNYALYGTEPDLDGVADAVAIAFDLIKPTLDASRKKSIAGKNGGSKEKGTRKQTESKRKAESKQTEREIEREVEIEVENENDNDNDCLRKQATLAKENAGLLAGESGDQKASGLDMKQLIASFKRLGYELSDNMRAYEAQYGEVPIDYKAPASYRPDENGGLHNHES